jgi:hypothetical protein
MNNSPFVRGPDSFALGLSRPPGGLTIAPFESAWGMTEEMLCTFRGVLIGTLVKDQPLVISLTPALDRQRAYDWPSGQAFLNGMLALLSDTSGWWVRCERDVDQEVPCQVTDMHQLRALMAQVVDICCTGIGVLPTFVATPPFPERAV